LKGIILAGGRGSRLYPLTTVISKQLLPIYNKPLIYYPLSVLMLSGITDILMITTATDLERFQRLFGDGGHLGIQITYKVQKEPVGIPDAFVLGEKFIDNQSCCLILGDNIFYGYSLSERLRNNYGKVDGAHVYAYRVQNPSDYGVVSFDKLGIVTGIEEKPISPKSHYVIPGIYYYDEHVCEHAKSLKPSKRGELEITDLNKIYLSNNALNIEMLGRGVVWFDAGTYDGLLDASNYVKSVECRQGEKIACIEEIAYRQGFINKTDFQMLAKRSGNTYQEYLQEFVM